MKTFNEYVNEVKIINSDDKFMVVQDNSGIYHGFVKTFDGAVFEKTSDSQLTIKSVQEIYQYGADRGETFTEVDVQTVKNILDGFIK